MSYPITQRDIAVLNAIDDFGFLTTEQIRRLYFSDCHRSVVYRRLGILHKRKLLKYATTTVKGCYIWRLTSKAASAIGSSHVLKTINHNTVYHDVLAAEIRIMMEGLGIGSNWTSSNRLLRQSRESNYSNLENIPDWLFTFHNKSKDMTCALEVEISLKTKRRIKETVEQYRDGRGTDMVWYFVYSKKMGELFQNKLRPYITEPNAQGWLHYTLINDFLSDPLKAKIHTMNPSFEIGSVCNPKKLNQKFPRNGSNTPVDKNETESTSIQEEKNL